MSMHMMTSRTSSGRRSRVGWALAAALLAMPMLANAHEKMAGQAQASSSMPMDHKGMGNMDAHAGMSMTGDIDYDFAVNMRKHHQMALMMSEAQLKKGTDAKLRALSMRIIAAQKKDIAELDAWIAKRGKAKAS